MSIGFRLWSAGLLFAIILATGTTGFSLIEGWNPIYAFYVTVITATTVAFVDPQPLSSAGQVFNVFLAVFSVLAFLYVLSIVLQLVVEGELGFLLSSRSMRRRISGLRAHYVVCGYGRVGSQIAREFSRREIPFVIIEQNVEALERLRRDGHLFVEGDPTADTVLGESRLEQARGLLAASDSDSQNTYIALTAKSLYPKLLVVARAGRSENEAKLARAGAERVVSPYRIAGRRMALTALQPALAEFVDAFAEGGVSGRILSEVAVTSASFREGKALGDLLETDPMPLVLGILRGDGKVVVGPGSEDMLFTGDVLILLGDEESTGHLALSVA
jgi:voltage-gated potassium channel